MAELFRKTALDTMATPEQLDKQVKIMRPSVWIIYAALAAAVITFAVWSFTYKITNGMKMSGVVFTNNNIVSSTADRECKVTDVLVSEGDYVETGDIIAVVSNDGLLEKIEESKYRLSLIDESGGEYALLSEQIEKLVDAYIASTVIKSGTNGYIRSVKPCGSALSAGDAVSSIMSDGGYNEVSAYVSLQAANSLSLGMTAQVSPFYAPREEYGYMTGVITSISDTPVSEESIIAKMGTMSYVEGILPNESCVEVRIRLDLDENSANSYKWSNGKGEKLPVAIGTQCAVVIVTSEYLPAEMLIS
ncbi:MAG: biotin/lipoyl-binding protein [Ruminococcus sp.]|nr:biotin/lipoyl-binding protein [Ruminococcus sp.]MCM1478505.1 biotin/lipoyl-binding protein [Muribaculaceae bacterium]